MQIEHGKMTDDILISLEKELVKMKEIRRTFALDSFVYKQTIAKVEELYERALLTTSKTAAAKLLVKIMGPTSRCI